MLLKDFIEHIKSEKIIIVFFVAKWCTLSLKLYNNIIKLINNTDINYIIIDMDDLEICNYCNINTSCIIQVYQKNIILNEYLFACEKDIDNIINKYILNQDISNNLII
jgi:hypothetical protein